MSSNSNMMIHPYAPSTQPKNPDDAIPTDSLRDTYESGRVKRRQSQIASKLDGSSSNHEEEQEEDLLPKSNKVSFGDDDELPIPRESWRLAPEVGRVRKRQDELGEKLGKSLSCFDLEDDDEEFSAGMLPQNLVFAKSSPHLGLEQEEPIPRDSWRKAPEVGRVRKRQDELGEKLGKGGKCEEEEVVLPVQKPKPSEDSSQSTPEEMEEEEEEEPTPRESWRANPEIGRVKKRQDELGGKLGKSISYFDFNDDGEEGLLPLNLLAKSSPNLGAPLAPPQLVYRESMGDAEGRVKKRQDQLAAEQDGALAPPELRYRESMGDEEGRVKKRQDLVTTKLGKGLSSFEEDEEEDEEDLFLPGNAMAKSNSNPSHATKGVNEKYLNNLQSSSADTNQEAFIPGRLPANNHGAVSGTGSQEDKEEFIPGRLQPNHGTPSAAKNTKEEFVPGRLQPNHGAPPAANNTNEEFVPGRLQPKHGGPSAVAYEPEDQFIPGKLHLNHGSSSDVNDKTEDDFMPGRLPPNRSSLESAKMDDFKPGRLPPNCGASSASGEETKKGPVPGTLPRKGAEIKSATGANEEDDFVPGRLPANTGTDRHESEEEEEDDFVPGRLGPNRRISNNEEEEQDEFVPGRLGPNRRISDNDQQEMDDDFVPGRLGPNQGLSSNNKQTKEEVNPGRLPEELVEQFEAPKELRPGGPTSNPRDSITLETAVASASAEADKGEGSIALEDACQSSIQLGPNEAKSEGSIVLTEASTSCNSVQHDSGTSDGSLSDLEEEEEKEEEEDDISEEEAEEEKPSQKLVDPRKTKADEEAKIYNAACCIQTFFLYSQEILYWEAQKQDVLKRQEDELADIRHQLQLEKDQTEVEIRASLQDDAPKQEPLVAVDWTFSDTSFAWVKDEELMKEIEDEKETERKLGEWIRVCTNWNMQLAKDEAEQKRNLQDAKTLVKLLEEIASTEAKLSEEKSKKEKLESCIEKVVQLVQVYVDKGADNSTTEVLKKVQKANKKHQRAMNRESKAVRFAEEKRKQRKPAKTAKKDKRQSAMHGSFIGLFDMDSSGANLHQSTRRRKKKTQDKMHESFLMDLIVMDNK